MEIKNVPLHRLAEVIAGLVEKGLTFQAYADDRSGDTFTITLKGGY